MVLIIADDMGWGELSINGNSDVKTEALDTLARGGAQIDRFYAGAASAPSRATILTGRHCLVTGVTADALGAHVLHEGEMTLGEALRESGYDTGYFGEWWNGENVPHLPVNQGFAQVGDVDDAVEFVKTSKHPFFCVVSTRAPGFCTDLDEVKRGLAQLDALVGKLTMNLPENTVVVFTADNGPTEVQDRKNGQLFGWAGSLDEGGLCVPSIWFWPERIPAGLTSREISRHTDIFPTLLSFAGVDLPEDRSFDGMDLTPVLTNEVERWPKRNFGAVWIPGRDLSKAKLSYRFTRWVAMNERRPGANLEDETWAIYDLLADPYQNYDLGEQYPWVLAALKSDTWTWFRRTTYLRYKAIPTQVGREDWSVVRLSPRAALLEEYPGDDVSVLTGWVEPKFAATWVLDVKSPSAPVISLRYRGEFAAELLVEAGETKAIFDLPSKNKFETIELGRLNLKAAETTLKLTTVMPVRGLEIEEVILDSTK